MVTEVTELHVFDYGTGCNVWTLFVGAAGTYREGRFEGMADGDEMMRFCASFRTHQEADRIVRESIKISHNIGEHITVFRHKL